MHTVDGDTVCGPNFGDLARYVAARRDVAARPEDSMTHDTVRSDVPEHWRGSGSRQTIALLSTVADRRLTALTVRPDKTCLMTAITT